MQIARLELEKKYSGKDSSCGAQTCCKCICYLILTAAMLAGITGFVFDFIKKYNQEITKEVDKIRKC